MLCHTCSTSGAYTQHDHRKFSIERLSWMMSRRGKTDVLWSDNFKSYKNADKELRLSWEVISSDITQKRVQGSGICWKFISTRAPHWRGDFMRDWWSQWRHPSKRRLEKRCWREKKWGQHLLKLIDAPWRIAATTQATRSHSNQPKLS